MLRCDHNNCEATFRGDNKEYVKKRHVLSAFHDCDNGECFGCVLTRKERVFSLFKSILDEAKTNEEVEDLERRIKGLMYPDACPGQQENQKLYIKAIGKSMKQAIQINVSKSKKKYKNKPSKLQWIKDNSVSETSNLLPDDLLLLLEALLDETDKEKLLLNPVVLLLAASISKHYDSNYISSFAARNMISMGSSDAEKRLTLLQRMGLSASYSYFIKLKDEMASKSEQYEVSFSEFLQLGLSIITFDNVQKGRHASKAGSQEKGTCDVNTCTVARRIQTEPFLHDPKKNSLQHLKQTEQFLETTNKDQELFRKYQESDYRNNHFEQSKPSINTEITSRRKTLVESVQCLPATQGNPSSKQNVIDLLDKYKGYLNDKSSFLGCDGNPYLTIRRLQIENPIKYGCFHLISGALHEEMNLLEGMAKLYDSVGILNASCIRMLQNKQRVLTNADTHKTISVIIATHRALVRAMVQHYNITNEENVISKLETLAKNNKLGLMLFDVVQCGFAYELFHRGIRIADEEEVFRARKYLYPLLHVLHHTNYCHIVADDAAHYNFYKNIEPDPLYSANRRSAAYFSVSGIKDLHQGCDALQEEINRSMLKYVSQKADVSNVFTNQLTYFK